jgi:hypothetical protein
MTSTHGAGTSQQYCNGASSEVKLMIHHQFPGIELVSPGYAYNGATCHLSPSQRVDAGSTTQIGFNITYSWEKPIGILMYELKRKNTRQSNKDATSDKDKTRCIQLAIIWEINSSKELCVISYLIEHDKRRVWDRYELMKLAKWYKKYDIHIPIELTYLMHDNSVLMKRVNVTCEDCYKLEMIISKGSIRYDTQRLLYIGLDG